MAAVIESFEGAGLVLRRRFRRRLGNVFTVAYGEILTAERTPQPWRGLRLHVRTAQEPVRVACRRSARVLVEDELRRRGVRVVDEYGAMITPTFDDFAEELAKEPERLRQSSDDA